MVIPFTFFPTKPLISFLRIHLFTLHKATKAFSCTSGFCKKVLVLWILNLFNVFFPNWYLPKYPNLLVTLNRPWDSLKANASLKPIKSFCKKGIVVVVSSSSFTVSTFSFVGSVSVLFVKLVSSKKLSVIPKFLVKVKFPINSLLSV